MHRCSAVPWQGVSLSQPHVCPWHNPHGLSSATAEAPGNNPRGLFREPGSQWMSLEVDVQLQILALPTPAALQQAQPVPGSGVTAPTPSFMHWPE